MTGVPPGASRDSVPVRSIVILDEPWAKAVAAAILQTESVEQERELGPFPIDECWVGTDLAIYLRYRLGSERELRFGRRIPDPHIDPTSGGYALDARSQGVYFYYDLPGPPEPRWVDRLGYRWYGYGPSPSMSWEAIVDQQPRIITLRELAAGGAR